MRVAIFDYATVPAYGTGKYNLRLLRGLCREHDFTAFSTAFENPAPERIRWVRVPCPRRPLALLFVSFHLLAPLFYLSLRQTAQADRWKSLTGNDTGCLSRVVMSVPLLTR